MQQNGNKSNKTLLYLGLGLIALLICGNGCSTYNSLVGERESVNQAWAAVENQYQRRLDLIPNLVETVKGYAAHESQTFEKVTAMRTGLVNAYDSVMALQKGDMESEVDFQKYTQSQANLNRACGMYINAVHEAYPDLKANENFKDLQVQLEGTENRIATQRQNYTQAVQQYNVSVLKFPANIWAGIFGFKTKPQYAADEGAQHAPRVQF